MSDQTISIEPGDIVAVRRAAYWHVGIADGRGHAISRLPHQGVVRLPLETFARSRQVRLAGAIGTLAGLALNFVGPNWIAAGAVGLVSAAAFALTAKPPRAIAADDAALGPAADANRIA